MDLTSLDPNKPIVWVTQIPSKRDPATGKTGPSVNIGPAAEHGQLAVMLPSNAAFYASADLVRNIRDQIKDYNFERGDCVLALGDPAVIAVTAALVGRYGQRFRILKWDRQMKKYLCVEIAL